MQDVTHSLALAESYLVEVDAAVPGLQKTEASDAKKYLETIELALRQIAIAEEVDPSLTHHDIGIDGFKAWAYCNQGVVKNLSLGQRSTAINDFKTSLEYKELATARWALGLIYIDMGNKQEAIDHLRRAIELDPENIEYRKQLDRIENDSALMVMARAFQGSWFILGFLSFFTFWAVYTLLTSPINGGLFSVLFFGVITFLYWKRKTL